jgi:uncharacterized protein YmfQ (DUF2313 family)
MANPFAYLASSDFLGAVQNLLPRGLAWPRDLGSVLMRFWAAVCDFIASYHADVAAFSEFESFPDTSGVLLPDWERAFGLPDACTPQPQTIAQRHAALDARITDPGGESIPRFIALALALGFVITITEPVMFTCQSPCDASLFTGTWHFVWYVKAPSVTVEYFTCQSGCDEALASWGNAELECVINHRLPAHTLAIFTYG